MYPSIKLPLIDLTVGELLRRSAKAFPERTVIAYDGQSISYAEMDRRVDLMARCLISIGAEKGDHIGIYCEAEPDEIIAKFAITRIGCVAVLYNINFHRADIKPLISRSDTKILLIGDGAKEIDYYKETFRLEQEIDCLKSIYYIGIAGTKGRPVLLDVAPAAVDVLYEREAEVDPQDTAFMLFTSGTTSEPKIVMDSHYSRANCGIQQAKDLAATKEDVFCAALPTFHCFSMSVNIMSSISVGACMAFPVSRRTKVVLDCIQDNRCTIFSCVPTLFNAIISRPDFSDWDVSSIRTGFIGGSTCSPEMFKRIEDAFGMILLSSMGQTEATGGYTTAYLSDSLEVRSTTLGHFMDHLEGRIVDSVTGEILPNGKVGEICVKGYVVMQGYYGMPEATAKTIDEEGFLHTGDMGFIDENGNLHLTGRLKEIIIRSGENISPLQIEALFDRDKRIKKCKAVGIPDPHYGELVCLCVILAPGAVYEKEEMMKYLKANLVSYQVPEYILYFDRFPETVTGKVRFVQLAEIAEDIIRKEKEKQQ
jgi:fatty-acyl-CoA synthase